MCSCPDECSPVNFLSLSLSLFFIRSLSLRFHSLLFLAPSAWSNISTILSLKTRKKEEGRESNKKSVFCSLPFLIQSTPSVIFLPLPFHYSLSLTLSVHSIFSLSLFLPLSFVTLPQLLLSDPTIDGRNCEEKSHEYPFQFSNKTLSLPVILFFFFSSFLSFTLFLSLSLFLYTLFPFKYLTLWVTNWVEERKRWQSTFQH